MTGRPRACRTTHRCARPISAADASLRRGPAVLLEVANLDVRYGRNHAVKGLNLTVGADGLITVLGSNGAGKSSLLRAIQGLTPCAGGPIRFAGEDVTRL